MYNGRHCIKEDYYYMDNLITRFLSYLNQKDKKAFSFGELLVKEIKNFDFDIATKVEFKLESAKREFKEKSNEEIYSSLKERCIPLFDELISNILVDIKEHSEK